MLERDLSMTNNGLRSALLVKLYFRMFKGQFILIVNKTV